MHGKFHYVDQQLREASIPYDEILSTLVDGGYQGYLMTEFEDEGGYDVIEQNTRHIAMVKQLLSGKL